jgi:Flp pilus assembly protein TadG
VVRPVLKRRQFRKSRSGSALIEFAMLAPIFFVVVIGLVEFVLFEFKALSLNHLVSEAARNLRTGEDSEESDLEQAFRDEACVHTIGPLDCNAITFDVRAYDDIGSITFVTPTFDEDGNPTNFQFNAGGPNQYSVVRASVPHQFIAPFMGHLFNIGPDMPALVTSYTIVRNEPW